MLVAAVSVMFLSGALGMLVAAWIGNAPTGPGYWRLVSLLILGGGAAGLGLRASSLGHALPPPGMPLIVLLLIAAAALVAFVARKGIDPERQDGALLGISGVAALAAILVDPVLRANRVDGVPAWLYAVGLATVGIVLGAVVLAMILAHWYLIDPKLPIEPLNRVLVLFMGTEVLKLVMLLAILAIHGPDWMSADGGLLRALVLGDALFVAVRAVLGVAAPLGLAWMTWKTVQIRSIQSATGILYAAIVFVLFGELISLYLSLSTGTPF